MFYVHVLFQRYTTDEVAAGRRQWSKWVWTTSCRKKSEAIDRANGYATRATVVRGHSSDVVYDNQRSAIVDPMLR